MKLSFAGRHLSIRAFPDIELPKLSVIVGPNGSGKTQLLQAINNGRITNSVAGQAHGGIQLLSVQPDPTLANMSFSSLPEMNQNFQSHQTEASFYTLRKQVLTPFFEPLNALIGSSASRFEVHEDWWSLPPAVVNERIGADADLAAKIDGLFAETDAALCAPKISISLTDMDAKAGLEVLHRIGVVSRRLGKAPHTVSAQEIMKFSGWGKIDIMHPNLAMIFVRYRDAYLKNKLISLDKDASKALNILSDDQFVERFGQAPWLLLNDALSSFGLPYSFQPPHPYDYTAYSLILSRIEDGETVHYPDLSSGEKVILDFALSTFQYDAELFEISRPKLLLIDEMDASLHPEMVSRWLGAIENGIVGEQGITCVLTTHSPTTVALAPEAALFEMVDGQFGLRPISKQNALNRLTFGVPTLSIDYSGRRQVFTESDTDAEIFERVYSLIKSQIKCERELNFISTGMRNKDGGEINSGCTVVRNIVERLNSAGNVNVFGIVDWDSKTDPTDRVKVVAHGRRDGIENVLLDPVLICLLLMKFRSAPKDLEDISRFAGADALSETEVQRLADAIQGPIVSAASEDTRRVEYIGGKTAMVAQEYLTMDDHALEDSLRRIFPHLRKWSNRGALSKAVVEEVLTEHREFCPTDLRLVFEEIANLQA
jgi:ABC-type branched-subunit amino acid transport system ATPase component